MDKKDISDDEFNVILSKLKLNIDKTLKQKLNDFLKIDDEVIIAEHLTDKDILESIANDYEVSLKWR